nr:tyrosine-protein phosphatase non-receptor type 20 isoform X8 [Gorilla gorilla gorilla]
MIMRMFLKSLQKVAVIPACGQPEAPSEETGGAVRMRRLQGRHRLSPLYFLALELKNLPGEFNSGNQPSNREKNRYRDILPYDSTRVPLGKSKDYINASCIRIVNCGEEYFYIATQGPLLSTIDDFWQMVLENNLNVIAMITREIEGGIIKCYHYWPISLKKPLELKHFRVFLENYQILQYFIIRMFQVVEKSFNIMDIVAQMREQRSGMVQTKEQYHFCYNIVLEVLRKLLTLD